MSILKFPMKKKLFKNDSAEYVTKLAYHDEKDVYGIMLGLKSSDKEEPITLCVLDDFKTEMEAKCAAFGFFRALDFVNALLDEYDQDSND